MSNAPASPVARGNPWASLGQPFFAQNLIDLLPPTDDDAFGALMQQLLSNAGQSFADLHAVAYQLSEVETIPEETIELLPNWNLDFGLPDCCTPLGATLAQQRAALLAKIASVGGQSKAYFIAVAAALGWTITIDEGAPSSFAWTVHAAVVAPPVLFRAGASRAGDLLELLTPNTQLECVLRQIAPAHTVLTFSYP